MKTDNSASSHDMKKDIIVHYTEPAPFSIQSEERTNSVKRLVREMSTSCFIYQVDFQTLSWYHELCAKKKSKREVRPRLIVLFIQHTKEFK